MFQGILSWWVGGYWVVPHLLYNLVTLVGGLDWWFGFERLVLVEGRWDTVKHQPPIQTGGKLI